MMPAEQRHQPRQRMKPEPMPVALVPIDDATLTRLDALIEHLLELRDILDGDQDMEPEHHDGAAVFPGHPLYDQTDVLATEAGPGDPADAEDDDPLEDVDDDHGADGS